MKITAFYEISLRDYLDSRRDCMRADVLGRSAEYLRNVDRDEYIGYLANQYSVEPLTMGDPEASSREASVPAEMFPNAFDVTPGNSYKKDVITYHLPFQGELDLLRCRPSTSLVWAEKFELSGDELEFEIINFRDDAEAIRASAETRQRRLRQQLDYVNTEVRAFNASLAEEARRMIEARLAELGKRDDVLNGLSVPIRRADDASRTFAVPSPGQRRKIEIAKAPAAGEESKPHPTVTPEVYGQIIEVIHDVGRQLERLPSTYKGKDEEALRDFLLMFLETNFVGSATGETFNRSGKTDILLRHEGTNVFIAECKFWSGPRDFHAAIDQLLGYLTWRDSKAALIVFVPSKNFTRIVESMPTVCAGHSGYVRDVQIVDETCHEFRFALPDDPDREVWLSILLFHLPAGDAC